MRTRLVLISALLAHSLLANEQWGMCELTFEGPSAGNPYVEVQFAATFNQGERRVSVPGFWDGANTYRIRFSPPSAGEWRFETRSATPALNSKTGTVTVARAASPNHGPVEVFDTFYLRYADGSPYHQFGTTCYAWIHQTRDLQEQTLKTLAASPFNKLRFCIFPKSYVYNTNEPELFAFQKNASGKFDFSRPDPAFWRHLERRILDLQKLGIEADIILWHPYDRWGFADMNDEQDDRYLRYCIARLSAYRNVWWSLANEYDFMTEQRPGHRGNKQWADWDRFFSILQREDPHQRLRGIHNGAKWYDHTKAWVTHASLQTSDMNRGVGFRAQYRKPVIYDECRYEGDVPQGWGNLTPREMTQRFWLGTMSGCYVGHGETYKHSQDILWWAKGGVLHGQSPRRIQWLKDFMAKAPPFHELQPTGNDSHPYLLAKRGEYYLLYCTAGKAQSLQLPGTQAYKIDTIDPWEMKEWSAGTAQPGEFSTDPSATDLVYRFIPYAKGERLRPELRPTASPVEGIAPLTVAFSGEPGGSTASPVKLRWDFGDGTTSTDASPRHTYAKPGVYPVTVEVQDGAGASARKQLVVSVDRNSNEPLLRAGFANGEYPALALHGTARRGTDGSLHLPNGAPWGRTQAGAGPSEDLRGAKSFTIAGWLKPESLATGSGGNRILFCLLGDHSGIDLVCHSDGRLRLAVNQWPDAIKNDSSLGKLQVGKWTFFAVSYDGTQTRDNVHWYFSPPSDAPTASSITLDRRTSYAAGPVAAEVGPLAIGNFNETMSGYGWDRQFRGEMRQVQAFASRIGNRGALNSEAIQKLAR